MKLTAQAYAKINLYLDIISKRDNGYHDIKGVMHKISLSDTVSVNVEKAEQNEITLSCSEPHIPTGRENIAYRAAELYLDLFSTDKYKVDIHIEKRIPAAGGLAGGSTDAAAVLWLMQEMLGGTDIRTLSEVSARLGADVPFCLSESAMITEGIGDILTPCPALGSCAVLICNTGESVSTPAAYAKLDRLHGDFKHASFDEKRFSRLLDGLTQKDITAVSEGMFNIFEEAVLCECPLSLEAKSIMLSHSAIGAMMSGSGSTVFGLYRCERDAVKAYEKLKALGYSVHICSAVG